VLLLELLDFFCALQFVTVTGAFNSVGVEDAEVTMNTQSRTVLFVLLIAKLTVIELEVWGEVVQDHGESAHSQLLRLRFGLRCVHEDGGLRRVGVNVEEHFELGAVFGQVFLQVSSYQFDFGEADFALRVVIRIEISIHVFSL